MQTVKNNHLVKIIGVAVFSALAFVVALVCNVIPPIAGFLSLDVKDAVITIAAFSYGPVSALAISLIAALIELITFSTTGWYGFVMNFVSSAVFSVTASLIYSKKRTINGALISLFAAVIATTGAMLLLNNYVTPLYLSYIGVPIEAARSQVEDMLPTILLPFNFAKTMLNGSVVMLLYKPTTRAMSRIGLIEKKKVNTTLNKSSVAILIAGAISLVVAVTIFIILA